MWAVHVCIVCMGSVIECRKLKAASTLTRGYVGVTLTFCSLPCFCCAGLLLLSGIRFLDSIWCFQQMSDTVSM